jgi:hypothetical protein
MTDDCTTQTRFKYLLQTCKAIMLQAKIRLSSLQYMFHFWQHNCSKFFKCWIIQTSVLCTRVKWTGRVVDRSPLASAEIKNEWSCNSTPPYAFMPHTRTTSPLRLDELQRKISLFCIWFWRVGYYILHRNCVVIICFKNTQQLFYAFLL